MEEDQQPRLAREMEAAMEKGQIDIMTMNLGKLPDHIIDALSGTKHTAPSDEQIYTALLPYDKYLNTTQGRSTEKADVPQVKKLIDIMNMLALFEKNKRLGNIKSYSCTPHPFHPECRINCEVKDKAFFHSIP